MTVSCARKRLPDDSQTAPRQLPDCSQAVVSGQPKSGATAVDVSPDASQTVVSEPRNPALPPWMSPTESYHRAHTRTWCQKAHSGRLPPAQQRTLCGAPRAMFHPPSATEFDMPIFFTHKRIFTKFISKYFHHIIGK